jgi:hypothetical protein
MKPGSPILSDGDRQAGRRFGYVPTDCAVSELIPDMTLPVTPEGVWTAREEGRQSKSVARIALFRLAFRRPINENQVVHF